VAWWPSNDVHSRLLRSVQMGHVRGVGQQLDALAATPCVDAAFNAPARAAFVAHARGLLKEFQLDALERWLATPAGVHTGDRSHAPG
jgi:hypothetical protein